MKKRLLLLVTILVTIISSSFAQVGEWRLNNNADDTSGNSINGTLMNSPVFTTDRKEGSHAISLNGSNQYIDLGNPAGLPSGTSARTLSAWAKTNTVTGYHMIVSFGTATTSKAMILGQFGTQLLGGGYGNDLTVSNFWTTGVWHHVCLTYDGTTARLYVDGAEVTSATKTWDLTLFRAYIGRQVNNGDHWNGAIDDVRIYNSALSAAQVLALATPVPAPPSSLTATVASSSSINLSWSDNSTDETGFKIERSLTSGSGYSEVTTTAANATSFSDTGLAAATTYYYRISAVNAGGQSAFTSEANATTLSAIPVAPTAFMASVVSPNSISLSWTDASNNETGFQIERSLTSGTGYALIATTSANAVSHIDDNLTVSTTYYYRMRAINAQGSSDYTPEVNATTTISAPSAPSGLAATAISSTTINLNWTDNSSNEVEFEIERSQTTGSGFTLVGTSEANATVFTDTTLISGLTYYYRIKATNSGGSSAYSNEANATTLPIEGGTQLCQSIYCDSNGNVAVGSPYVPAGYKMAVHGKIMAEGVKVLLESAWPDYVFDKDYKLRDIETLRKFIQENGHLPNVPAAKIIEKEGMDVEQINIVLLEKIEELSLYLIQMEERINKLEEENESLRSKSTRK